MIEIMNDEEQDKGFRVFLNEEDDYTDASPGMILKDGEKLASLNVKATSLPPQMWKWQSRNRDSHLSNSF